MQKNIQDKSVQLSELLQSKHTSIPNTCNITSISGGSFDI